MTVRFIHNRNWSVLKSESEDRAIELRGNFASDAALFVLKRAGAAKMRFQVLF